MPHNRRLLEVPHALEELLRPEPPIEQTLLGVAEFRQGLLWGEPRFGHPEGKVAFHVREVLDNVERIPGLDALSRQRLRLVALAHDTFKYAEDRSRPRDWSKHHGLLARRFMERYTDDRVVLDLLETHDDAYYIWMRSRHDHSGPADTAEKSLAYLQERIGYCLQLYYLFFKCDTQTGDKTQASIKWFEKTVEGISILKIKEP
jgi:hypothetical protein